MNIAAGKLDQKVVIKTQTYTQSSTGATTPTFTTQATVWASVKWDSSSEPKLAQGKTKKNRPNVYHQIQGCGKNIYYCLE